MNEMNMRYDDRNYRDYDERDYDNRYNYRYDERDYYNNRNRDYDRRGGKINNRNYRNYRNYREQNFHEELDMFVEDMRNQYRELEDIAEMAENMQDKNTIMRVAQKEKENYNYLKQIAEK